MRKRFTQPRRRRLYSAGTSSATAENVSKDAGLGDAAVGDDSCGVESDFSRSTLHDGDSWSLPQLARVLWRSSYDQLFEDEYDRLRELCGSGYSLPPSSYATRLKGEQLEVYQRKLRQRERDQMAIALHSSNMRLWTPSLMARSVVYFNHTTSFTHGVETQQRRLASRPTTYNFLRLMRDARPAPTWEVGHHVQLYVADQTYEWVGMQKGGRRQLLERHDAHGMPIQITHEVYINSVKLALPASLGCLSSADRARIANNHGSPYTEDFHLILNPLQPGLVDSNLSEFTVDAMAAITRSSNGQCPSTLSIRTIANALFGRPNVDPGGASEFDILAALMNTDTKSYDDLSKIFRHLSSHSHSETVVEIFDGDGQSAISGKNLKKRYPDLYARWLIAVGGFHEHAHFMFAITEGYWRCLLCMLFVTVLQFEQIREVTQNLEHNAYAHHQNGHHVVVLGIMCYLLQDVVAPSPTLLMNNFDLYLSRVNHAGGIVICQYLRCGGFPIRMWQYASRTGNGLTVKKLFAYGVHICRSVVHKPNCVQILLIGLLGLECTLPALQNVLLATMSISLLGRPGSNIYLDRLLEYINNIQQGAKRSAHAASFGRAVDLTTLLRSIMHVRHTFQASEKGHTESDDPITQSMLVQARLVQDFLVRTLGRDLTVHDAYNPFWYTGNPVLLYGGDFRYRTPWIWVDRVQTGRSAGKHRARQEQWDDFALRMVLQHMFPY